MNKAQTPVTSGDRVHAQTALKVAWNHFEWAVGEKAVDAAIYEVNVAEFQFQEALNRNGRLALKSA